MHLLYNLSIHLLQAAIWLAALFNPKAKKWVNGRRHWRANYRQLSRQMPMPKTLWVHVSSLGEFEQGRPVIEQFRSEFPDWRIVLTFFSPSGYEVRKDYPLVDAVWYLPADTPRNAHDFIEMLQPTAAIFVKYDFWANHLFELKKRGIPTLLVSALFRPSQPFFRWYGGLWRQMLGCFTHIFVQNSSSATLLQHIDFQKVTIAGDTRVDRVLRIAEEVKPNPVVEVFAGHSPVFVVGSSWEADEQLLIPVLQMAEFQHYKIIVAPHEPSERNVKRICGQFKAVVRYSNASTHPLESARVLVIDNIGLLNTLYRYGSMAYIGGGFGAGIHNTLEPAAFGLPIIFGPKYAKFEEARQFVARGGAFVVHDEAELLLTIQKLQEPDFYEKTSSAVLDYLAENKGATEMAISWLRTNLQH
jgi:3-deoxy-D-manno-octulosonic-acid transferase